MSLEIRCNCGWHSQVSEFYLGDRVHCPECGRKLEVHENTDVPYGYPPYTTWAKQPPTLVQRPGRRRVHWKPTDDPHAKPAFWTGFAALLLSLVGCGALPAVLLAIFAFQSAGSSRRFCTDHRIARSPAAGMGGFMGGVAIVLVLASLFGAFFLDGEQRFTCEGRTCAEPVDDADLSIDTPACDLDDGLETERRAAPAVEPERQPVEPRNRFEYWQSRYSERIREQHAKSPAGSDHAEAGQEPE